MMVHRHFDKARENPHGLKEPEAERFDWDTPIKEKFPKGFKAAVYAGTRNLYGDMVTAAKSLLVNADVDRIWFLIEDDRFPYEVGPEIECVNVREQTLFSFNGPNATTNWTYMVLMRAALSKLFPGLDRILSLDVDTIVARDISDLWDTDMGECMVGMVQEYHSAFRPFGEKYWNAGIMLQDLKKLREGGFDDRLIAAINHEDFRYNEQCAINKYCAGRIYDLPVCYNSGRVCGVSDRPAIVHFVGRREWQTDARMPHHAMLLQYRYMSWDDVYRLRRERYGKRETEHE